MFSCEFCQISKNTFLQRTPLVAASIFGCLMTNFEPLSRDSRTYHILNTVLFNFWPEGPREPRNEVGFLSPAESLVEIEISEKIVICFIPFTVCKYLVNNFPQYFWFYWF